MLRTRARRWAIILLTLVLAAAIIGTPVYVYPQIDQPRHADAILILGGYEYDRYRLGLGLAGEGWAPAVAVSNPNGPDDPERRTSGSEITSTNIAALQRRASPKLRCGWRSALSACRPLGQLTGRS